MQSVLYIGISFLYEPHERIRAAAGECYL